MPSTKLRLLLGMLPMLAACASMTDPAPQSTPTLTRPSTATRTGTTAIDDPLCAHFRIVALSRYDTTATKAQVIANNAVLAAVCGPTARREP